MSGSSMSLGGDNGLWALLTVVFVMLNYPNKKSPHGGL